MPTQVGFKNIHVAKILSDAEGVTTYDAPRKISQSISADVSPNFTTTTLYADDQAVEVEESLGDIDVTIGIRDLDADDYAYIMGVEKNADGVIEDRSGDSTPYMALGFEIPLSGGAGSRFYWYYKGKFTIPGNANTTKGESVEFQTPSITGKFMSREDGKWRARVDENDVDANSDVVRNWFNEVYESAAPTPTV